MGNKIFLDHIHNLRGLAILLIVGFHARTSFSWGSNFLDQKIWFSILTYGTIIFVFIAGYLFQYLNEHSFQYKRYLGKKIKFVISPYLIASIPAIIHSLYFDQIKPWEPEGFENWPLIVKIGYMLITGKHWGPFWFIPMITIFYLLSPLLIWLDKASFFYKYFFPLLFIVGLFFFQFGYTSNPFESFLYFFPIYILGMWASRYSEKITKLNFKIVLLLLLVYFAISCFEIVGILPIGMAYSYKQLGSDPDYIFNFGKFKISILCVILIYLFFHLRRKKMKTLAYFGTYSFGVFFVHLYVIRLVERMAILLDFNIVFNFFSFLGYFGIISFLCIMIIYIISSTAGSKSRLLIGS